MDKFQCIFTLICFILTLSIVFNSNKELHIIFKYPFRFSLVSSEITYGSFACPEDREIFDWESILGPCSNNTLWTNRTQRHHEAKWRSNALKSSITECQINPAGSYTKFLLESKTKDGTRKSSGGDFWRAEVTGTRYQHGYVRDLNDGFYEIWFRITEPGNYTLNLILEYSVCDGLKDPPEGWFEKGNLQGKFQEEGILGYLDDFLVERMTPIQFEVRPSIEHIAMPLAALRSKKVRNKFNYVYDKSSKEERCFSSRDFNRNCNFVWDGYGHWKQKGQSFFWQPNFELQNPADYKTKRKLNTLWFLGDSVTRALWDSSYTRALCKRVFKKCKQTYIWLYEGEKLGPRNVGLKFNISRFLEPLYKIFLQPEMKSNRSVIVINFGLHVTMTLNFSEYRKLLDTFLKVLDSYRKRGNTTVVPQVVWKTTTLSHKENIKQWNVTHTRFLTNHRINLFNTYTNRKLCSAGITILDIFPISASFPKGTKDHVHYEYYVFEPVEDILADFVWKNYNL